MHVGKYIPLRAVFSSIKNIKTAERNRLTERHLANILRIKNASFDQGYIELRDEQRDFAAFISRVNIIFSSLQIF